MAELESYTERMSFDLHDTFVIDGGDQTSWIAGARNPVHFGGLAIAFSNVDPNVSATISVEDSPNGTVWSPVLFSTHSLSNQLAITIVPLGQQQILFVTQQRYIRFSTTPFNPVGVRSVTHQWIPRPQAPVPGIY